jgi:hypothetical protein
MRHGFCGTDSAADHHASALVFGPAAPRIAVVSLDPFAFQRAAVASCCSITKRAISGRANGDRGLPGGDDGSAPETLKPPRNRPTSSLTSGVLSLLAANQSGFRESREPPLWSRQALLFAR